ncbi:ATP-binding protein [Cellulomonas wangsupingiae]|uniref:ATP-binding protein n=1 Tax=Cellulomonas wangsupingiae TaxID=2968085 RepID=A0ABY5K7E0_9CELL|nr:ATP-binding protein [Cellulomonas wangsupingiae]MCC2336296.1 ATP-binding protein [Cellulomonas wangsupingiae]MCM0640702.1 ATP-binding protein [Cellulomonas wangsupingiae]UUI65724.1 ATP-binding protein [Cellulomonas wangsupingiae]
MGEVRDLRSRRGVPPPLLDDEVVLTAERTTPRQARHWVMRAVAGAGVGGASNQVIELLTGELVTNAVIHGPAGEPVRVAVRVDGYVVRVAVTDRGGGVPQVRHPEPTAASGRGMALVEALSTVWGSARLPDGGTTVWFEVDTEE